MLIMDTHTNCNCNCKESLYQRKCPH